MKLLWQLFFSFFKVGMFTFGGGYAMIPLLQAELVDRRKWISESDLMDYFSVGQCTPGIIAVNVATFCGYKMKAKTGAAAATFGIVAPSMILIMLIASVLRNFWDNPYAAHAFAGIRIVVVALIAETLISFWKKGIRDKTGLGIFIVSFGLLMGLKVSPAVIVLLAVAFSVVLQKRRCK